MNTYKKTLLTLSLSLITIQAYCLHTHEAEAFMADDIRTFIKNEIRQPFQNLAVNNLFDQPIPETFFNNLATAATIVKDFIETTGRNDSDLMKAFQHTQNATNLLINGMKACYQKLRAREYQAANSILKDFITLGNNMKTIREAIDKMTFNIAGIPRISFSGKREARDVLENFAELLTFIASKAQKDIVSKLPKPEGD